MVKLNSHRQCVLAHVSLDILVRGKCYQQSERFFNFAVLHHGMTNKSIKACRQRQNQAEKLNPSLFKTNSFSVRESGLASQCIFDHKDLVTCAIQRAIFKNLERIPV